MPQRTSNAIDRAWANSFATLLNKPKEPTGPGWRTIDEIKDNLGVGWGTAYKMVAKGLKTGDLEAFHGQQKAANRICQQTWYRPVVLKGVKSP